MGNEVHFRLDTAGELRLIPEGMCQASCGPLSPWPPFPWTRVIEDPLVNNPHSFQGVGRVGVGEVLNSLSKRDRV